MSAVTDEMRALAAEQTDERVKKMLAWAAVELDDRAETISGLDDEIRDYSDGYAKLALALQTAKAHLGEIAGQINLALWQREPPAVDLAPFKNVMAHHGVEPYAKKKRTKKVPV